MSLVMDDNYIRVVDKIFGSKCIVYSLQRLVLFLFGDEVFLTNSISSILGGLLLSNFSRMWNFRWELLPQVVGSHECVITLLWKSSISLVVDRLQSSNVDTHGRSPLSFTPLVLLTWLLFDQVNLTNLCISVMDRLWPSNLSRRYTSWGGFVRP